MQFNRAGGRTSNVLQKMNLRCQHCGEWIIARSFGKCPGCYRDLPDDLQLSPKEMELAEMEEMWRSMEERGTQLDTFAIFPPVFIPKEKELDGMEKPCKKMEESRRQSGGGAESMGPSSV